MSDSYQFKFRSAIFQIQLNSPEPDFIREQMKTLLEQTYRLATEKRDISAGMILHVADVMPELVMPEPAPETEAAFSAAEIKEISIEEPAAPAQVEPATPGGKPPRKTRGPGKAKAKKAPAKKGAKPGPKPAKAKAAKAVEAKAAPAKESTGVDVQSVAASIKGSDNFDLFQKKILNKPNQLNRILLGFYFADQLYAKKGLTTGDVEAITEALGAGIKSTNISSQLKKHEALFNAKGERKRGSVVHYSLNKKGREEFEKLMQ